MKRLYLSLIREHLDSCGQMIFLVGPRQAGKTTVSLMAAELNDDFTYLNWDNLDHRKVILSGVAGVAGYAGLDRLAARPPVLVFDEIHKYGKWKTFLKGFYDTHKGRVRIIVTGSSRLDVYRKGGDSLMGRYFSYRMHQLSLAELGRVDLPEREISPPSPGRRGDLEKLLKNGGFPEPFLKDDPRFLNRWRKLRRVQLMKEDIRDLSRIQELGQMEILGEVLKNQSGRLTNYTRIAGRINVSSATVRRWIRTLEGFFYCFTIQPWSKNVPRSLLKEPKTYLWDWVDVDDEGRRAENLVASHLLKAVHYWTDRGLGEYGLWFFRDKEKREVDFLVSRNGKPWFLVEVKLSSRSGIGGNLAYFQKATGADHAFQVVFDLDYVGEDCFQRKRPVIVPAATFLSQLV